MFFFFSLSIGFQMMTLYLPTLTISLLSNHIKSLTTEENALPFHALMFLHSDV